MIINQYEAQDKQQWNQFVRKAKNSHFMFEREYMEYHADRFIDHSLMVYQNEQLVALLPGSLHEDTLISHGGLTFGGFIVNTKMRGPDMCAIFDALKQHLIAHKIKKLRYKAVPHIYHQYSAEEDLYALFVNNAQLVRRDVSSTIVLANRLNFSGGKRNGVVKAKKNGVVITESKDFVTFFSLLNEILKEKYNTKSTHVAAELDLLAGLFPHQIKMYAAYKNEAMLAGVIMYLTETVAHAQYMASSEEGRDLGALDLVLYELINNAYQEKKYFDFGISTENAGRFLNVGLISQKEMFGARSVVYDTYELEV